MKTFFALGALACFASANADLVGHWNFDETSGTTAYDSSPSGYNGALNGGASFVTGGVSGGAISLSTASNSYVSMGNVLPLTGSEYAISAWIKTTSTGAEAAVAKHDAGYYNGFIMQTNAGSGYGAANKVSMYTSDVAGGEATSTSNINDGNWHLVTASRQGGLTSLYVDGNLEIVKATNNVAANSRDFLVGGVYAFTGNVGAYNGLVDDLQVYDKALTANDVSYLYNNPGAPVPEPATMACLLGGLGALIARRKKK
jgi:hypothetical protein